MTTTTHTENHLIATTATSLYLRHHGSQPGLRIPAGATVKACERHDGTFRVWYRSGEFFGLYRGTATLDQLIPA